MVIELDCVICLIDNWLQVSALSITVVELLNVL